MPDEPLWPAGGVTIASPPADQAQQSSAVLYRGSQLKVTYEALNALDGYLVANSNADQSAAMQSFVNAVGGAAFGGGIGIIPPAVLPYKMGSTQIVLPTNRNVHIKGEGGAQGANSSAQARNGTVLQWNSDTAAAPETQGGIVVGDTQRISDLTLDGPQPFATHNGVRVAAMAGLQLLGSGRADHLGIQHFGAAVLIGGFVGGVAQSGDHWNLSDVSVGSSGFGVFCASGTTTAGDVHLSRLRINATLAAIAQAASVPTLQGGSLEDSGLYAPYGILRWDDGLTVGSGVFLDSMEFRSVNIESPGNGCVYDELYNQTHRGSVSHCLFGPGMLGNIQAGGFRWTATWTPGALTWNAGTPNQITVQVPFGGFVFRPAGAISDVGLNIPAGTTVTAVTGTWPNGVAGAGSTAQYTLTLSNNLAAAPTGNLTYTAPIIGKIAVGTFSQNTLHAIATSSGTPLIVAQIATHNKSNDGTGLLTAAQNAGIINYAPPANANDSSGNEWGTTGAGATRLTTLPVPSGKTVNQWDVVEQIAWTTNANFPACQPAGTTGNAPAGKVVGTAQKTVVGGGSTTADLLTSSQNTTVNNKSASPIASGALLKADYANPGGVTTAASATDGPPIGAALAAIAAGATGSARIWF